MARHDNRNKQHQPSPEEGGETEVAAVAVTDEAPAAEPVVGAPAETSASPEPETALAAPEDVELAEAHPDSLADLVHVLPHRRRDLLAARKVHPEEFSAAIEKLSPSLQANFRDLLDRMNPDRDSREMGAARFQPSSLRLYQGVGEKPKNPKLPKGGVEDSSGTMIIVPEEHKDTFDGIPQRIAVSVVFMAQGRSFWPPRGPDGQPQVPAGIEIKGNQMICGSQDRIVGSRYGKCDACPYKPSFDRKDKACKDHVEMFVVRPDLSGVYQVTLSVTSFRTALKVIEGKANGWRKDYAGQFFLEPLLVEKPGQNYYVWKASPVTSKAEPNGVLNAPEVVEIMDLIKRQIRTEVFFPRLAGVYARQTIDATATEAGSLADIEAAAGGADYSGGATAGVNNINA